MKKEAYIKIYGIEKYREQMYKNRMRNRRKRGYKGTNRGAKIKWE